ncbi:MAG TPA: hypothetical protein GXX40_05840 [Firmicutes bacterium]|nr:hypothetical protein [Bacillota bacterium]
MSLRRAAPENAPAWKQVTCTGTLNEAVEALAEPRKGYPWDDILVEVCEAGKRLRHLGYTGYFSCMALALGLVERLRVYGCFVVRPRSRTAR